MELLVGGRLSYAKLKLKPASLASGLAPTRARFADANNSCAGGRVGFWLPA